MRPRHYSYTPEAAATNSISLSQAVVGAAALTQTRDLRRRWIHV